MLGMSMSQKGIVLEMEQRNMGAPSRVQNEFKRRAVANIADNIPAITEPSVAKISSYLSYQRKKLRGGVPVGRTTLEDLSNFAASKQHGKLKWAMSL